MSSKLYPTLATIVIAVAGAVAMTSALAVEATQFAPEAGAAARADVKADKARTGVVQHGEAIVFVDRPATQGRVLANIGEETGVHVVRLGEATQFIDRPGNRSRADVRAETLAALRSARHQ